MEPKGICPYCGCDNSTVSNESHQLECGSILAGTYLVGKVLGQGGFGITYVGWDLNLNMKVAIKEYYPEGCVTRDTHTHVSVLTYAGTKETYFRKGKESFVEEARTLARFSGDSGVVGVRTFFYENGTAYIVMDFVEGETLKSYAARNGGRLPAAEVLSLFRPLMKTLAHVHDNNLLHRDISPDNIMVRSDGTLALLDFGAARQISAMGERSNTINVKHGYAPEEQYRTHGEQGPWTDIYALCATIYRLTTGVTPIEALDRAMNEKELAPPNQLGADFTSEQESAIMHGLAVRANFRTHDMRELIKELYEQPNIDSGVATRSNSEKRDFKLNPEASNTNDKNASDGKNSLVQREANDKRQQSWAKKLWPYVGLVLLFAIIVMITAITKARARNAEVAGSTGNVNATDSAAVAGPASGNPVVKIGIYEPASGDNGAGGKLETLGIEYAHSVSPTVEINGTTYDVQLVKVDKESSNDKAASAASTLVSAGVSVVLGSYGSGVSIAASPTFEAVGIPAIGINCTNPLVTEGNKHYFRICFLDPFQGTILANYAFSTLGVTTAYCLSKLGDDYSSGLVNYFVKAFEALGGTCVQDTFPDGNSDFTSYINNAKNNGAQVFFSPVSTEAAQLIIDQAESQALGIPILAGDTWDSNVILQAAKGKSVDVTVTTFYPEGANAEFDAGFKAWVNADATLLANNGGDDTVSAVTAMGYDAYFFALEAMKRAAGIDPAAIMAALWSTTYEGISGPIALDQVNGDAIRNIAYVKHLNNETGKWEALPPVTIG